MSSQATIKSITYMKNHAAELVREVTESGQSVTITQNGAAKVVVMDVATHDRWRQTMALLKLTALGERDADRGHVRAQAEVFDRAGAALERHG